MMAPISDLQAIDATISSVEAVLRMHSLHNKDGMYRWQEDISDTQKAEATYILSFIQSVSLLGFKIPLKNTIKLTLRMNGKESLIAVWSVDSQSAKSLCRNIIAETKLAIYETLAEFEQEIVFESCY